MPQQQPFDPTSLGQALASNPGVRAQFGWKDDITPYEALRELQKQRAQDPDIDEGLKLVEAKFGPLQIPEAPTWGGTFTKHAVNELGFGLPQRYHWAGFNINPEEQDAPGSSLGSAAGMLGGFLLPGGLLGGAAKVAGAGRLAKGLGSASKVFRTGDAAAEAMGTGRLAGHLTHGGLMAGIGGTQGAMRSLNTQTDQMAQGKRTEIDPRPLLAEALGNAVIAPFGGGLTGRAVTGMAPRAARNVGMALGAAKGVGGMGILGGAQRMTENPGMNPIDATLGQDPTAVALGALGGGLAGRGRLGFLSPGGKYLKGVYGGMDNAADEAAAALKPAAAPVGAPAGNPAITPNPAGTGVPPPVSLMDQADPRFAQYQAISKMLGSRSQRLAAGARNKIETWLSGAKDLLQESSYDPQLSLTRSGELIGTTGSSNKFGARAGAFTKGGTPQYGGLQHLNPETDIATHFEPSSGLTPHQVPGDQYRRLQGKPLFATVEGQQVQVKFEAPDHYLALTPDKGRLIQIPKPAQAAESLGSGGGGAGSEVGTGIAAELAGRAKNAAAGDAASAEVASQSRLRMKDFSRLENVIMQIMNEPGAETTLAQVMAENPDLAPYIAFIAKRAHSVTAPKAKSGFATATTAARVSQTPEDGGPNVRPRRKKAGQQSLPGI